jgi:Glutamate decarboxylase and related PLP-dependent proteins
MKDFVIFSGIIAACWATMMYFGLEGYVDATKKIVETTKYIEKRSRGKYIMNLKLISGIIEIQTMVCHTWNYLLHGCCPLSHC